MPDHTAKLRTRISDLEAELAAWKAKPVTRTELNDRLAGVEKQLATVTAGRSSCPHQSDPWLCPVCVQKRLDAKEESGG